MSDRENIINRWLLLMAVIGPCCETGLWPHILSACRLDADADCEFVLIIFILLGWDWFNVNFFWWICQLVFSSGCLCAIQKSLNDMQCCKLLHIFSILLGVSCLYVADELPWNYEKCVWMLLDTSRLRSKQFSLAYTKGGRRRSNAACIYFVLIQKHVYQSYLHN